MKARLLILSLVVAAILGIFLAAPVAAEWTYDLEVSVPYPIYTYRYDEGVISVSAFDNGTLTAYIYVYDTDLTELKSFNISVNGGPTAHAYSDGLVVLTAANGASNEDIFIINASDGSIVANYTFSPAGEGYVQTYALEIAGDYIYQLMYDSNLSTYFLQIYNSTGDVVNAYDLGAAAVLAKVENSDYLVVWNGTTYLNITDGAAGDIATVDTVELGLSDLMYVAAWFDPSENATYIAFTNSTGTYLAKHIINGSTEYVIALDTAPMAVMYVGPATDGIYVVTADSYGYRVVDSTVKKEYIPPNAFGHALGSEYLFSVDIDNNVIYRWLLEVVTQTVTTTETVTSTVTTTTTVTTTEFVTATTTETQVVYVYTGAETETTTVTVQGPYTEMDLLFVGIITFILGLAAAYLITRR